MAKVTFGPIVSEARNKVGGVVFSRNPHGAFSRAWAIPPYTNTAAQAAMRAALGTLSTRWRLTLTDEQREGWRSLGCRYKHVDVFAQKSNRPGLQAYLRANLALSSVGAATLDDAPRTQRATDPQAVTAAASSGSPPSLQVDALVDPQPSEAVQVWVSPQLGSGRNYFFRKMRLVHTEPAGTAAPWDPSTGWSARFGALSFPSKLGIGVRYIDTNTGAIGPWRTALINSTEGEAGFMTQDFVLTHSDILAMVNAPVTILGAPPAGKTNIPLALYLKVDTLAGAYTNVDTGAFVIMRGNNAGASTAVFFEDQAISSDFFIDSVPQLIAGPLYAADHTAKGSTVADSPLFWPSLDFTLSVVNAALGNFTGGDPANTIKGTLVYQQINAP